MKKVHKSLVDELIKFERQFAKTGDVDNLDKTRIIGKEISRELYDTDKYDLDFSHLFDSLVGCYSVRKNGCTNAEIYEVLKILGIEVIDERQSS